MTHLPFIIASYTLAILVPLAFALSSAQRLRAARVKLSALERRRPR